MVVENYNGKSLIVQLLWGRYFMAFATILILSVSGTSYIFGLYSNEIKASLGYDQTTLNLLSFFKDLGAYITIHAGLVMEVTTPQVVLLLAAAVNFFGYFMIFLAVTHRIPKPSVWQMCLYICIGADALGFTNTGALVTCVKNFPGSRGTVIGVLKGFIGLGGAIINQFYHVLCGSRNTTSTTSIILLLSWRPTGIMLAFSCHIRAHKVQEGQPKRERRFFHCILYISLALALFLMVITVVQNEIKFSKGGFIVSFLTTMVLLLLPLVLVVREECSSLKCNDLPMAKNVPSLLVVSSSVMTEQSDKRASFMRGIFNPPPVGEDHTILQATFRLEMLILVLASICGTGGQITMIDNLGQIGTSLGYPTSSIATSVSLVSIWQYLGRVLVGLISDQLLVHYQCPRSLFLTVILLLSSIGHLLIAFNVPYGIYLSSIIIGFCLGAEFTLLYTIISEIFGLKHYATLYNYGTLGAPLGSYIFNVKTVGQLYDTEGMNQLQVLGFQRKAGELLNCEGVICFRMAFFILAAATLFSTFASLILVARTRKFYRNFQQNSSMNDA